MAKRAAVNPWLARPPRYRPVLLVTAVHQRCPAQAVSLAEPAQLLLVQRIAALRAT